MKIIFLYALICFLPLSKPNPWMLTKEMDGIKIYSRHSEISKFDDIKTEANFPGNITQLAEILMDVPRYVEWAYATKSAEVVKKISNNELIYYSEINVPWPSSNRDFYSRCKLITGHVPGSFKIVAESIQNYGPEKKGIVRIPLSKGIWEVTTLSDKMIHVEYILELDPGGVVPAWLLNLFSTKGPMETFVSLKKKMQMLNR